IEHGRGDSRHHVGGARARGGDGDSHLPAGARVAVRHVRRSLLVAHQNMMDLTALQRVICGQNRSAGITEYVGHSFTLQALPQDACAAHTFDGYALVSCNFVSHGCLVLPVPRQLFPWLLKSKTHQASVSGGAGFGSLQDFLLLSSLVPRSEEHTSELQSRQYLVCRLLL